MRFSSSSGFFIDLFSLKILALLLTKDTLENKANLFFDTVIGQEGLGQGKDSVSFKNSRMQRALKKLVFFSEIMPLKYSESFTSELTTTTICNAQRRMLNKSICKSTNDNTKESQKAATNPRISEVNLAQEVQVIDDASPEVILFSSRNDHD